MTTAVRIKNGYQGKVTGEFFLPAGAVVEVEDELAEQLIENGHAEESDGDPTHGLTGPISDGAAFVPPTAPKDSNGPGDGNKARIEQLMAMNMSEVVAIAKSLKLKFLPVGLKKATLVDMIVKAEQLR